MKLSRAEINNFRSIKYASVQFDPHCRVLVGINESGKSNLLKSLSLLGEEFKPNKKDDIRDALPDEGPIKESNVMFIFNLEKEDTDGIYELVSEEIATTEDDPIIIGASPKNLSIKSFCQRKIKNGDSYAGLMECLYMASNTNLIKKNSPNQAPY